MPLTVLLHGDPRAVQQVRLGQALVRRGHRVVVCDAPLVAERVRERGPCVELPLPAWLPQALRRRWVQRQVQALGVDVVHLNFIRPWHVLWSRMRDGPPYVATAWGSDLNDEVFRKKPRDRRRIDHVLCHAAALTADSEPLLAVARARAGGPRPSRIVLWGVDLGQFDRAGVGAATAAWRSDLAIGPQARVVLSPRQTKSHYFVDRILRAFAASRFRDGGVLLVKLFGRAEEEPVRAELVTLARTLGVADRIRFVPPCGYHELPALYALADVAVTALEVDGFPSTLCELLALGVPVVATDLPAYRGVLEHDETALLVPPGDHDALVAALDRLAGEPELAERLRRRGRALAIERADWEKCVDGFEAVYREAMAAGRRSR